MRVLASIKTGVESAAIMMRLDKAVGTYLLLWPTLWALWFAYHGKPPWWLVMIYGIGCWIMRSAGCVINDIFDRDIDGQVARTQHRPLVSGQIRVWAAVCLAACLGLIACLCLWLLPTSVWGYGVVGAVLAMVYPSAKRFLKIPQLFLGVTFAWGIPVAYASRYTVLPYHAWMLYSAVVMWVIGFDSLYSLQDLADDQQLSIYSAAKTLGIWLFPFVALCYGLFWVLMMIFVVNQAVGVFFWLAWLVVGISLANQIWQCYHDRVLGTSAGAMFKQNGTLGFIVMLGLLLDGASAAIMR